jgi:hypothetical protein
MIRQSVRFGDEIIRALISESAIGRKTGFRFLLIALSREIEFKPALYHLLSSTLGDAYRSMSSSAREAAENCTSEMRIVPGTLPQEMNWMALRAGASRRASSQRSWTCVTGYLPLQRSRAP